jgi:hypothetical protein
VIDMRRVKWFKKATGASVCGVFVDKKVSGFGIEALIVKTDVACSCFADEDTLRTSGVMEVSASPGDLVGFGLTLKGWKDFEKQGIEIGDVVELTIQDERVRGSGRLGRRVYDESLGKVRKLTVVESEEVGAAAAVPRPSRPSWSRILALASGAYSTTEANGFREKAIFLIGSIIDLEADQDLSGLVARAAAAKKAYDDEYTERGCWKVGDDGESNHTRWLTASHELAKAMIGQAPSKRNSPL